LVGTRHCYVFYRALVVYGLALTLDTIGRLSLRKTLFVLGLVFRLVARAAGNGERDGHGRASSTLSVVGSVRSGRDGLVATAQLAAAAENVGAIVFAQGVGGRVFDIVARIALEAKDDRLDLGHGSGIVGGNHTQGRTGHAAGKRNRRTVGQGHNFAIGEAMEQVQTG
jgi:hypothetical protein